MGLLKNDVGRPSNNTKKIRLILKGILIFIVLFCIGYTVSSLFLHSDEKKTDAKKEEEIKEEQSVQTTTSQNNLLPECKVEKQNYNGLSKAEMLHKRLTMGWWNYLDNGNITSKKLDSYTKISSVMYDLGYINFDKDDYITNNCQIQKNEIDKTMTKTFEDNSYDPNAFSGNNCISLNFTYDNNKKIYEVKNVGADGCGGSGAYIEKVYDSKETNNIYTFKTKVLMYSLDGIMNISENNEFNKITEGIPEGVTEDNVIDKYSEYDNIYEWTFVKKNNDYAFRSIQKIK